MHPVGASQCGLSALLALRAKIQANLASTYRTISSNARNQRLIPGHMLFSVLNPQLSNKEKMTRNTPLTPPPLP